MQAPKIITLTKQNIAAEHICCGFADKKCAEGYEAKKHWLAQQIDNGYIFKKFDIRGKVFIEYVSAEKAWVPIIAPDYMFINCFWVSGQYKGQGYGKKLFEECLADSQGMNGIVAISSEKKQPFLSDKKFFTMQGFKVCDISNPYFELLYFPLKKNAPIPKFKDCCKRGECDNKNGLTIYYSNECPFTEYYTAELIVIAEERGHRIVAKKIETMEQAQKHFVPFTIYSIFKDGKFMTQQILTEKSFIKIVEQE
jgi:GNAT superfamily N-acetyltransferase